MVFLASLLLVLYLSVVIHELGHYMMARYVVLPVFDFNVGTGPLLYNFVRRGADVNLRLWPIMGEVTFIATNHHRQNMAVYASGPLMNLMAAVMAVLMLDLALPNFGLGWMVAQNAAVETLHFASFGLIPEDPTEMWPLLASGTMLGAVCLFISVNMFFALVNLIPVGGRDGAMLLVTFVDLHQGKAQARKLYKRLAKWNPLVLLMAAVYFLF